jgi:hypothetical protein
MSVRILPPATTVNCSLIEGAQRDNTEDWIVPRAAVPTIAELEARIDEALVIARASEEGVREVGEMAIEAAREAKRAADAAEAAAEVVRSAPQAPAAADEGFGPAGPVTDLVPPPPATGGGRSPTSAPPTGRSVEGRPSEEGGEEPVRFEIRFRRFSERADRLSGRLRRLGAPAASVGGGRPRGDY